MLAFLVRILSGFAAAPLLVPVEGYRMYPHAR